MTTEEDEAVEIRAKIAQVQEGIKRAIRNAGLEDILIPDEINPLGLRIAVGPRSATYAKPERTVAERIEAAMQNQACTDDLAYVPYQDPALVRSEEEANERALEFLRFDSCHMPVDSLRPSGQRTTEVPRGIVIKGPWT